MIRVWLTEQWHDIRYAHKSLWASLLVLMVCASFLTWEYADHEFSREIAKRDAVIVMLRTQNAQLRAMLPKKSSQNSILPDEGLSDRLDDKMYELKNDLNNMNNNLDLRYNQTNERVQDIQNSIDNDVDKTTQAVGKKYDHTKQKIESIR
jgi:hypothetical protein